MFNFLISKNEAGDRQCCCGCSIKCGVIFVTVLQTLGLISAFASMSVMPILTECIMCGLLYSMFIWPKNGMLRTVNYILQAIWFWCLVIGALILMILLIAMDLPGKFCDYPEGSFLESECSKEINKYLWGGWACAILLCVPYQWLITSIFNAWKQELEDETEEGQKSNQINEHLV